MGNKYKKRIEDHGNGGERGCVLVLRILMYFTDFSLSKIVTWIPRPR
jgi:hypothetical protein